MIHNMQNVRPTRYSLLHIDEAMNDIKLKCDNIKEYNVCGKQLKYLHMYLSRLHNIIGTDARNTSAQRVRHDRTGLCEHAPSIHNVKNFELRENAAYESILYFTYHKNIKMQIGIMKEKVYARLTVNIILIIA